MGVEYKIKFEVPKDYDPYPVLRSLPSPIGSGMIEIYNYSVESYGFYFLDNLVDQARSGHAMKLFIDEGLKLSDRVEIEVIHVGG